MRYSGAQNSEIDRLFFTLFYFLDELLTISARSQTALPFRGDGREVRRGRLCPEEKSLMRSVWENIYIYVKRIQEIWRCEGKNVFLHNT